MATTPEKVTVPGGGDYYDYVEEQREMVASQRTVVPVADIAEADAIAAAMAAEGRAVSDTNPLVVFNIALGEMNVKTSAGWANTPWQALTLQNSWVAYTGGGGYYLGLKCRKKDGKLLIHGMVKSGAVGSVIATLPAGFYPNYTAIYPIEGGAAGTFGSLVVSNSDGTITYRAGTAAPPFVSIDLSIPLN